MHQIVDAVFEYGPVFRVRELMSLCNTSRPTAQKDINRLIEVEIVQHLVGDRPRTYFVPAIFGIAYSDDDQNVHSDEPTDP